jgi:hypothetical protein
MSSTGESALRLDVPHGVPLRLAALGPVFDVVAGHGASVGQLSSLLGEELLIELVSDWLSRDGRGTPVRRLPEKPTRDDDAFAARNRPGVRDLDAWLLRGSQAYAVEAKMRTAASLGQVSPKLAPGDQPRARWDVLQKVMSAESWNQDNKVALPLRRPRGVPARVLVGRPIYAVWWPVSRGGPSDFHDVMTATTVNDAPREVTVFSGSLYVRHLLSLQKPPRELLLRGDAMRTTMALLRHLGCVEEATDRA